MASPSAVPAGGKDTPISRGVLARIGAAASGAWNGWFGPGEPMAPSAPPDVKGRQFDYSYGVNLTQGARRESNVGAIDFPVLRRIADPAQGGLDLLRLAIETRKNQMAAQPWAIVGRKADDDGGERARKVEIALRRPDGITPFRPWMRMLFEDHFVIDAPALYFGNSTPERPLLEVMDGGTIKRLLDEGGRTPMPPLPAFQQYLHGLPANDYTVDELAYHVFNPRSDRIYGMSPVEQVVGIVTMALNRQLSVLEYFTAGTIPDGFYGVPESWNVDQISQYQKYWDSILTGQLGARRGLRFVPGGGEITFAKDQILKNEFDEWIARIICYAFSLPPSALVNEVNRATAETAKETGAEEGLEPEKLWFKDVMDDALERIGAPELQWQWKDEEIVDAKTKSEVISSATGGKPYMLIEEARKMGGLKPATPEQLEELRDMGAVPDPLGLGGGDQFDDDETDDGEPVSDEDISRGGAEKAFRRGGRSLRSLRPLKRNRAALVRTSRAIRRLAAAALTAQRDRLVAAFRGPEKLAKVSTEDANRALQELAHADWTADLRAELEAAIARMAEDRSSAAMAQLDHLVDEARYKALLSQANERAVEWAKQRVGNLITEVDHTTRQLVNEVSARAIDGGLTNEQMADALEEDFAFSRERSVMIARTETANADTQGALAGYRESGVVVGKQWSTDPEACDLCVELDGVVVPLDDDFPGEGGDGPPLHPNCECLVAPVVED